MRHHGDTIAEATLQRAHDAHTQFLADVPLGLPGPRIPLEAMRVAIAAALEPSPSSGAEIPPEPDALGKAVRNVDDSGDCGPRGWAVDELLHAARELADARNAAATAMNTLPGEPAQLRDLLADALHHLAQDKPYNQTVGRNLLSRAIAFVDAMFGAPDPSAAFVRIGIEITASRIAITARESAGYQRAAAGRVWHHDNTFPPRSAWRSQQGPFGERTSSAQRLGPALVEYLDDLLDLPTRVADQLPVLRKGGA